MLSDYLSPCGVDQALATYGLQTKFSLRSQGASASALATMCFAAAEQLGAVPMLQPGGGEKQWKGKVMAAVTELEHHPTTDLS